jgi:rhodanese-related sulfurtransferase
MPVNHWDAARSEFLLDVREPFELAAEIVPEAVNIPLGQLRGRLDELPRDKEINVFCRSAQRSYYATRILLQNGFKAKNVCCRTASRPRTYPVECSHLRTITCSSSKSEDSL